MSQAATVTALAPAVPSTPAPSSFALENFYPKNWVEAQTYAGILAGAPSMLPKHIKESKDPKAEIFATIMFGFEVGLAPMQALRAIYIVHGRAGMYAADQLSLILKHPDCERLEVASTKDGKPLSDAKSCTWVTKRRGRNEQRLTFTIEEAETEGLVAQNAKYKTAPAVMLRWRCLTRLLALTWGDVLRGLEEAEQVKAEEKDGGWLERGTTPPPPPAASYDSITGELKEVPEDAQVVDELAPEALLMRLAAVATPEELKATVDLVQKSKAAGRWADEDKRIPDAYKAAKTRVGGNGGGK